MARVNEPFTGLVMMRRDYRERDLLVKMLTDRRGPVMFFVRGARRRGFKLATDILPFTHGHYVGLLADDGLSYLVSAQETHHWRGIEADLTRNAYATYILDLVDAAFTEGRGIGGWYQQIEAALTLIDQGKDPQVIADVMAVQLLGRFGVAPVWDGCVICGQNDLPLDYSESFGGMLCQNHWGRDPYRLHLAPKVVRYLQLFAHLDLRKVARVTVDSATKRGLDRALTQIYDDQVGLHLRSKRFLDQMDTWANRLKQSRDSPTPGSDG